MSSESLPAVGHGSSAALSNDGYLYNAFLSYRHVEPDRAWARWLQQALETYRVPRRLMREHNLPVRLKHLFRDEDELAASADLSREIEGALTAARFLIVVCSPRTPSSEWVNKEVLRFREMGRDDRVLALLIEGEPSESFPRSLCEIRRRIVDAQGLSRETIEEVEPLAADVRLSQRESARYLKRMARLRILACLLNVRFDELRRRDQERGLRRLAALGALVCVVALAMGALGIVAIAARDRAVDAQAETGRVNEKLNTTNEQLAGTVHNLQHQLAMGYVQQGANFAQGGRPADAIATFHRAYVTAPSDDPLKNSICRLLGAWDRKTPRLLLGRQAPVSFAGDRIVFSPDGAAIVTPGLDGAMRVWDVATGRPRGKALSPPHSIENEKGINELVDAAFSPDGRTIVTAGVDHFARFWSADAGQPCGEPLKHDDEVVTVAFSPDGKSVLTSSRNGSVRLWDAATRLLRVPELTTNKGVRAVAFSPDGLRVATANDDGTARLWSVETGKPASEPLQSPERDEVYALKFSPNGEILATWGQWVQLWDVAKGKARGQPIRHGTGIAAFVFSPDSETLVTGAQGDNAVCSWDTANGQPRGPVFHHAAPVTMVVFSPDGRTVAIGSDDQTVRLWDATSATPISEAMVHDLPLNAIGFSPDGRNLATIDIYRTGRIWDVTDEPESRFRAPDGLKAVAFSPDGTTILTGHADGAVMICDPATGRRRRQPLEKNPRIDVDTFSADGRIVAYRGFEDETIRLWNTTSGQPHAKPIPSAGFLALSPDGQFALIIGDADQAQLWDAAAGEFHGKPLDHEADISRAAFSRDGKKLITAGDDGTVCVWDAQSGRPCGRPFKHVDELGIRIVALGDEGRIALTATYDQTVRLWDVATSKPVGLLRHGRWINAAAFSRGGGMVATAGADHLARLWDTTTGEPLGPWLDHGSEIEHVAFSPDGQRLLTASLRDVLQWQVPAQLPADTAYLSIWAAVRSDLTENAAGILDKIPPDDWLERWREFESRDKIWCAQQQVRQTQGTRNWHRVKAQESMLERQWQLAVYHWSALLAEHEDDLLRSQRGDCYAEQGVWDKALADFSAAMRLAPAEPEHIYRHGLALLASGNEAGYSQTCRTMIRQFIDSEDPQGLCLAGGLCVVSPLAPRNDVDELGGTIREGYDAPQFKKIVRRNKSIGLLGAMYYRLGVSERALTALNYVAEETSKAGWKPDISLELFLAMSHAELHHAAEAKLHLERANERLKKLESLSPEPEFNGREQVWTEFTWHARLIAARLLEEAGKRLADQQPAPPK